MTEILNERVKIFLEKHNLTDEAFTSIDVRLAYMRWINYCVDKYCNEEKIKSVINHDEFTEYLKYTDQKIGDENK